MPISFSRSFACARGMGLHFRWCQWGVRKALQSCKVWPAQNHLTFLFHPALHGKFTHLTILQYLFSPLSYTVIYLIRFLHTDLNRLFPPLVKVSSTVM